MEDCLFCKIIRKEIPANIVYEDGEVLAFKDIHPRAPVHILVIPKEHIDDLQNLNDNGILVAVFHAVKKLVDENKLMGKGYKVEVNGGGAQIVNHLHFHLMGEIGLLL